MDVVCRTLVQTDVDFAHCAAIRTVVFVDEQHVPPEEELDDLDATSTHVLARVDGVPVGTGRLILGPNGSARIGRMAVLASHRGQGVGSAILLHLMERARESAVQTVTLSAQVHAIPFYERHGFVAHGEIYLDAGIEHRTMDRPLLWTRRNNDWSARLG